MDQDYSGVNSKRNEDLKMNKQVKLRANDILSHLILEDCETAEVIADTPEWDGAKVY